MPTSRALLAAAVPGLVVFADFTIWMGFSPVFAFAVGLIVALAALGVTRLLYDDADAELAAWQRAERELAETTDPADRPPAPDLAADLIAEPTRGLAGQPAPEGAADSGAQLTAQPAATIARPPAEAHLKAEPPGVAAPRAGARR